MDRFERRQVLKIIVGISIAVGTVWAGAYLLQVGPDWTKTPSVITCAVVGTIGMFIAISGIEKLAMHNIDKDDCVTGAGGHG